MGEGVGKGRERAVPRRDEMLTPPLVFFIQTGRDDSRRKTSRARSRRAGDEVAGREVQDLPREHRRAEEVEEDGR